MEGFHHVQLAMPSGGEAAATGFYAGALGMEPIEKPAHLRPRGGCWFRGGGVEVHLGLEEPFVPARKAHPALLVRGLDALEDALEAAGVKIVEGTQLEGHRRWYVRDPFGNRLELIEVH
jgi:catechol 2,3-dioxygenase-like lactoylglutathione lyase family enzyme